MDFATEDFSSLLLATTACQRTGAARVQFSHTPPKKERKKKKKTHKDRLTFGDLEPWHVLSDEEV